MGWKAILVLLVMAVIVTEISQAWVLRFNVEIDKTQVLRYRVVRTATVVTNDEKAIIRPDRVILLETDFDISKSTVCPTFCENIGAVPMFDRHCACECPLSHDTFSVQEERCIGPEKGCDLLVENQIPTIQLTDKEKYGVLPHTFYVKGVSDDITCFARDPEEYLTPTGWKPLARLLRDPRNFELVVDTTRAKFLFTQRASDIGISKMASVHLRFRLECDIDGQPIFSRYVMAKVEGSKEYDSSRLTLGIVKNTRMDSATPPAAPSVAA